MQTITFKEVNKIGNIVIENDLYRHFHCPEMLVRYDSNFIEFNRLPSLPEFKEAESYLRDYHRKKGQKHVKFYFPEDQEPAKDLMGYLTDLRYDVSFLELYTIVPTTFPPTTNHPEIEIQRVTKGNLQILLQLNYQNDSEFGKDFAEQKGELIKRQFQDKNILQLLAFYNGAPAGYVHVFVSEKIAEIDNLMVVDSFQKKGIGSKLQEFVMNAFSDKTIYLVADGEDTPREMYKKQNYLYQGFQYEAQKVYLD